MVSKRVFFLLLIPQLLFSLSIELYNSIENSKIYNSTQWKALLHYKNNTYYINDKKFLFAQGKNPKEELYATIEAFFTPVNQFQNENEHPICKFPARYFFIKKNLQLLDQNFPQPHCSDLLTYQQKAPADQIAIVYASEKVNNPSSMMGHTFLKFTGKNYSGKEVSHAVSFYTIIETFNVFKLLYQNFYSGMKGIFSLKPYYNALKQYTYKENRNLWEYQLKLTTYQRKLIYYHIWELKDISMKYYITNYNCSTVIYYILSLANPKIYQNDKIWITPLEIVKTLYQYHMIVNAKLIPSKEWYIKLLEEKTSPNDIKLIYEIVNNNFSVNALTFNTFNAKLLYAYSDLEAYNKKITYEQAIAIQKYIPKKFLDQTIDISHYKSPQNIPPERQLSIAFASRDDHNYMKVSFLPASHLLSDNNQEYFSESELKIGYLSLMIDKDSNIKLDEFTLYGMKSYVPYDILTQNFSYQYELTAKKEYTKLNNYQDTVMLDGGMGIDFKVHHDINIFAIANVGLGYNKDDRTHLFFNPEVGFIIYEILNMKSILTYKPLIKKSDLIYNSILFNHTIFFNKTNKLNIQYQYFSKDEMFSSFDISYSWLF